MRGIGAAAGTGDSDSWSAVDRARTNVEGARRSLERSRRACGVRGEGGQRHAFSSSAAPEAGSASPSAILERPTWRRRSCRRRGGVIVEDVSRDSPAETAGVKVGGRHRRVRRRAGARHAPVHPAGAGDARRAQGAGVGHPRWPARAAQHRAARARARTLLRRLRSNLPEIAGLGDAAPPAPPLRPLPPAPPAPPSPPASRGFFDFDELLGRGSTRLGVTVSDLQPQLADYFGVKDGVLVTSVTSDSAAAKAGVKAGDVITTLNGATVTSPADLRQRAARLNDGEELTLGACGTGSR